MMNAIHFSIFAFVLIIGEFVGYVSTSDKIPWDLAADGGKKQNKARADFEASRTCKAPTGLFCCGANNEKFYNYTYDDCCGTEVYRQGAQVCCGQTLSPLHNLQKNIQYDCCFNFTVQELKPYIKEGHLCCEGHLYKKVLPNAEYKCCGPNFYNVKEKACCDRDVGDIPKTKPTQYSCCEDPKTFKSIPFDSRYFTCCDGLLIKKEDLKKNYRCCAKKIMEYKESFCCGGQEYPQSQNTEQDCCNGKTYNRKAGQACCMGLKVYNNDTQTCGDSGHIEENSY